MSEPIAKVGMTPCHPGELIREEILNELHLPVARAAEILGIRRATLSDLVNGKAALSPEMALRIDKAFGVSMDARLRMQGLVRQPRHAPASKRSATMPEAMRKEDARERHLTCRPSPSAANCRLATASSGA